MHVPGAAAGEFGVQFRTWFPMAAHLLEGVIVGGRNRESVIAPGSGCSRWAG